MANIPDYQRRVRQERAELGERLLKLCAFICSTDFQNLHPRDKALLKAQRDAMLEYSDILEQRIEFFEKGAQ